MHLLIFICPLTHLRFLRILYLSVNVGPYTEDSVASFPQGVDYIYGAMVNSERTKLYM